MSYTAIIDYGAGNCTSVASAFAALGGETRITRDAKVILAADRVVFPASVPPKAPWRTWNTWGL